MDATTLRPLEKIEAAATEVQHLSVAAYVRKVDALADDALALVAEVRRLRGGLGTLGAAAKHLALATPDKVLRMELERAVTLAKALAEGKR